jgi:hypothetical protein
VHPNNMHKPTINRGWFGIALALCLAPAACSKTTEAAKGSAADASAPAAIGIAVSRNNRLKFKGGERFAQDLATGLDLNPNELCKELGSYDCATVAHNISLGGVEPYVQTIYQPTGELRASASNAVERIAMSACHLRAERDAAKPADDTLFGSLARNPSAGESARVAARLYQRLLGRDATAEELEHLAGFWTELQAAEKDPARAFSTYACFAIATAEEALFF